MKKYDSLVIYLTRRCCNGKVLFIDSWKHRLYCISSCSTVFFDQPGVLILRPLRAPKSVKQRKKRSSAHNQERINELCARREKFEDIFFYTSVNYVRKEIVELQSKLDVAKKESQQIFSHI